MNQDKLRNIAIIAHVDHGKTTLVDAMLKQTQTFAAHQKENQQTTILDRNELERERGVTILAKNTSVFWHDYKINILDTPGHADFSGEVERVLNMADGCILLVDAAEGVLSQTKFVLRLALELGLKPIVVINKVDRKDQRLTEVETEIGDLFLELAQNDSQLDFPVLYAQGIAGIAGFSTSEQPDHSRVITDSQDLTPLFTAIIETVPYPQGDPNAPLQLQVNTLDWDDHKGTICIGRIFQGTITKGQPVSIISHTGELSQARIEYLFVHRGLTRESADSVAAGEIVAVTGINHPSIGDTICHLNQVVALPTMTISEPTVKMQLSVNTSPFAGQDATFTTSRQIRDRLNKELETNVGLRVLPGTTGESVTLVGRGELHLAILIETMRREGYEFSLSRPEVVLKEIDGRTQEPWEEVTIEVPEAYTGTITTTMAQRLGQLQNMFPTRGGHRFLYHISTANLIGYRNELLTQTSGEAIMHSIAIGYQPLSSRAESYRGGALVAQETGRVTAYSLEKSQQRASTLVNPGDQVYAGQVVGFNTRQDQMVVNITKAKKLTNMRAAAADTTVVLAPALKPSLEQFLTLIAEDEMLEVTPQFMRLRKKDLVNLR